MANENRRSLYNALDKAGYDIGSYDDFDSRMNNAEDREKFFTAIGEAGYDIGDRDEFERRISPTKYKLRVNGQEVGVSEKEYKDFVSRHPKPSQEDVANYQDTINSARQTLGQTAQTQQRIANRQQRAGLDMPTGDFGRVGLGSSNRLQKGQPRLNPETGQLEDTYITESGIEYENEAIADMEQREIDRSNQQSRWEKEHPEETIDGKIASLQQQRDAAYAAALEEARTAMEPKDGIGKAIHDFFTPKRQILASHDRAMDVARQNKDVMALDVALRDLQDAKTMLKRNRELSKSSDFLGGVGLPFTNDWFNNWKNFGYGVWDALDDVTINFAGTNDLEKAQVYLRIKDKMERGEELTDSETSVALAGMSLAQAQQMVDLPTGYTAGGTTMEMAPFMIQMASNPASGTGKALARKAVRQFGRNGLKAITARVTARVAGNIGEAAVLSNTWQAPKTVADIAQRYAGEAGYDENGNIILGHTENIDGEDVFVEGGKSLGQAVWEGEAASIIENFTELGAGGSINGMLSKVAGSRLGKKIGLGYISDLVGKVGSTPFARSMKRFMEATHWDGMIEEPLEEEYGIILNSLLTGDNKISDLWDSKQQADIFAGTMWFGGMMAAINTAAYPFAKRNMRRKLNKADVEGEMVFRDEWPVMKATIDSMDDKDVADFLYGIKDDDKFSKEQKAAMFGYAARLKQYQGANVADMLMRMEGNLGKNESGIKSAYDTGTDVQTPDEMKQYADEATAAGESLTQYGQEFTALIANGSSDPAGTLDYLMQNRDVFDDEEIAAAANYYQKHARLQGVMDAQLDKVDQAVEQANAEVRGNMHQGTGSVVLAKGPNDVDYYVIGGDIVTDGQGMTSLVGTGGAVVVKDPITGEVSVKSPQELMVYSMQNADELIQQNETVLRQQLMQQADDDITFGSPANEVFDIEDTVTLQDGNGGMIQGIVVSLPNAVDGAFVVQTSDGRAVQMTADDMNRRIVEHNGMEVKGNSQRENPLEVHGEGQGTLTEPAGEPQGTLTRPLGEPAGTLQGQQGTLTEPQGTRQEQHPTGQTEGNAGGEAGASTGTGANEPSALSRIPVRTDAKGQPVRNRKGQPILDWHKASVEDAAAALVETTGGDMLLARDTASDMVKNAEDGMVRIRKQKPKGEDPIEIAESRMEIRRQEQEQQAIIKQWKDVGLYLQKQMRDEAAARQAAIDAAKSEEQRQREAEEARQRQEKQDTIEQERRRKQIEEELAQWNKPYGPLAKARREMEGTPEAQAILDDIEPRTLDEWVSSLIQPQSMLWEDETDQATGRRVIGLQSELGLQKKDIERIGGLVASRAKGGKPFGQVVHDIWEQLPEGMKNMYDDQDVRNALIGLFGEGNTMRMRHLTEEHRIEEARQLMAENERREKEAEMEAWEDFYHLTAEEREAFEDFMQQPPMAIEQEIINNIIADEQFKQSLSEGAGLDQQSVSRTDAPIVTGGQGQVQQTGEAAGNGDNAEAATQGPEAATGEPAPAGDHVAGAAQSIGREYVRELLRQTGEDTGIADVMSDYEVEQLNAMTEEWDAHNDDYGFVLEQEKDNLRSKDKKVRDEAQARVNEAQQTANESFEPIAQYIEELKAKYANVEEDGVIPRPKIDNPRFKALYQQLEDDYSYFLDTDDETDLLQSTQAIRDYVDEGLDMPNISDGEQNLADWVFDYEGDDPEKLAQQYIGRVYFDRFLDDDEDQEYIRTGIPADKRFDNQFVEGYEVNDIGVCTNPHTIKEHKEGNNPFIGYDIKTAETKKGWVGAVDVAHSSGGFGSGVTAHRTDLYFETEAACRSYWAAIALSYITTTAKSDKKMSKYIPSLNAIIKKAPHAQPIPSEQVKPTDLRDATRPESAELGVNEANARAREAAGMSDAEVETVINSMKSHATVAPSVEITDENWQDNIETPLGNVKMGENQKEKMFVNGREQQYGMLLETLGNPDIVLEEQDKEQNMFHERPSSYLFVKTFQKPDGSKYVHFESVTVSRDGMEVSVSSHIIRENQLKNKLKSDRLLYRATALDEPANSSAEQPTSEGSGLSSDYKGTNKTSNVQEKLGKTSSQAEILFEEQQVDTNPTDGQKEAGNYQKGHIKVDGFDITIENPKGSIRRGTDADGKQWEQEMHNTYGYIKGTEGVDGDHIDVFLSDNPASGKVWVIDQVNPKTGEFDEHKVMYGFANGMDATKAYLSNYEDGWQGLGAISGISREEFKKWVESSHRKTKPFREYALAKKAEKTEETVQTAQPAGEPAGSARGTEKTPAEAKKEHKRIVSDDQMEELRKKLRDKFGTLNAGIDVERMLLGAMYAVGKIERGVTKFADYAQEMVEEIGDAIRPYLKAFYNAVRDMPEAAGYRDQMDTPEYVEAFDVDNFDKTAKVPDAFTKAEQVVRNDRAKKQVKKIEKEVKQKIQQGDLFAGDLFGEPQDTRKSQRENTPEVHREKPIANVGDVFVVGQGRHPDKLYKIHEVFESQHGNLYSYSIYADEESLNSNNPITTDHIAEITLVKKLKDGKWKRQGSAKKDAGEPQGTRKSQRENTPEVHREKPIANVGDVFRSFLNSIPDGELVEVTGIEETEDGRSYTYKAQTSNREGKISESNLKAAIKTREWRKQKTESTKFRPATEADIDSNTAELYYQGKRAYIVAITRSGEQVGAATFSKPHISSVMLTNGKSVKVSELEVKEAAGEPQGAVVKRKTAWWSDENRPQGLDPSDYKTYMTDEAKEYFANHPIFARYKRRSLAFVTAAVWDGVELPPEELKKLPEVIEAERIVKDATANGVLKITDEERDSHARHLLDAEHGSAVFENGKIRKVNNVEDFSGPVRQERKALVIIGLPAGGKSSVFANPLSNQYGARIIDSDVVKPWLEGFDDGNGAGYVQDASSDVAERALDIAVGHGDNIILPRIGGKSVVVLSAALRLAGYDVQLYYNDVKTTTSVNRATSRFAETGRYLSLDYLTSKDGVPSENFSKFAEKTIGDYLDELSEGEIQKLRGRLGGLLESETVDGKRLWLSRPDTQGGYGTLDEYISVLLEHGRTGESSGAGDLSNDTSVFSYAEWKSNDVALGEKPKEIWNSESGKPMPGKEGRRNERKQEVSRKSSPVGEGAGQASGAADGRRAGRGTEPNRAERSGSAGTVESQRENPLEVHGEAKEPAGEPQGTLTEQQSTTTPAKPKQELHKNKRNNHGERGTDYAPTSLKARFSANVDAIKMMRALMDDGIEAPTKDEMEVLRRYSGWGGMGTYFNDESTAENKVLRDLLDDDEYNDAVMSINSAYYTPATVIDGLWDIAKELGFKGGNVLEGSAGIGNIIGQMPSEIGRRSDIEAVEIDKISGNILKLLYPDAKVHIQGFQDTMIRNGSVDLAVTNVPFVTGLHVFDKADKDLSRKFTNIHDFCIAKNIRKLREGGLGLFITSAGTLDKSTKLREWITDEGQADVIGAFRLNNETFGGTTVTSDIIVVRKRVAGRTSEHSINVSKATPLRVGTWEDKWGDEHQVSLVINDYFKEHPEMMAGEMAFGYEKGDTFRPGSYGLYPAAGKDQEKMLADFVKSMKSAKEERPGDKNQRENPLEVHGKPVENQLTAEKEGRMLIDGNGRLCVSRLGTAVPLGVNDQKVKGQSKQQCFKDYQAVQKAVDDVLQQQLGDPDDAALQPKLDALNRAYDQFVRRYGIPYKNTSISFLRNDIDFPTFMALASYPETKDMKGKVTIGIKKSPIFKQRVLGFKTEPQPKTVKDAVIASVFRSNGIDLEWIAAKLSEVAAPPNGENWTTEDVRKGILVSRLGFENPSTGQLEVRHQYLSGNVREKLAIAEEYNASGETAGRYAANVEELRKVVPMDIPAHLIEFSLGSSWIPEEIYQDFIKESLGLNDAKLFHLQGRWSMDVNEWSAKRSETNKAKGVYSEKFHTHILGSDLVLSALNNRPYKVARQETIGYGSTKTTKTVVDQEATSACNVRIDELKDEFKQYVRKRVQDDVELSRRLEKIYNDKFNALVPLRVDDEMLPERFEDANMSISLYDHQKRGVLRGVTSPTMLAHEVGTGKSFTLITTAMEMRRIGTAKKPMIVVQNATVAQMTADAKLLYPNAKVLSLSEQDRDAEGRRAFYAKIKFNDWDMIIIPQSTLDRIPDSPERELQFIQEQIDEKKHLIELARQSKMDKREIERMERDLKKKEEEYGDKYLDSDPANASTGPKRKKKDAKREAAQLDKANTKALEKLDRATDDVQNFDDLGVDAILVDEAHGYKHLGFETALGRSVKGVDPSFSKKCAGLYNKTRAVFEKVGWKNVVFATGTPISNTAAEIWTFMKYLMPADVMKANDIYYFDDFVHNFGSINQMLEFKTNGKFNEVTRFAAYVNRPELMRIWMQVADIVRTEEVGEVKSKVPEKENGKDQDVFLPQSPSLISIMAAVRAELERFENMDGKQKKENSSIPLTMYGIAKRAAIDPRLVNPDAADEPLSKTNAAVKEIVKDLETTKKYNGTIAVFCDNQNRLSASGGTAGRTVEFNIFDDMKEKLVKQGVPEKQIAIIKSSMSIPAKQKIFDAVNKGEVRVIMGSTQTLGTGVNIQERLHCLIHMDAPDRPMDYTQRNGRIERQGNLHRDWGLPIRILRFGVEDSLDVTAYQRLKTKSGFIDSIMNGKGALANNQTDRTVEEEEEGLFDNPVAVLSGSQFAMKKNQAERELRKLQGKYNAWQADQIYVSNQLRANEGWINDRERVIAETQEQLSFIRGMFPDGKVKTITVGKTKVDMTKDDSDKKLNEAIKEKINDPVNATVKKLRENEIYNDETMSFTVELDGHPMAFDVDVYRTTDWDGGKMRTTVHKRYHYSSSDLRLTDGSGGAGTAKGVREILDDIMQQGISGKAYEETIENAKNSIRRANESTAQLKEREGQPFQFTKELQEAQERVEEYTQLMKKELEEKEAKYKEQKKNQTGEPSGTFDLKKAEDSEDENLYSADEDWYDDVFYSNAMRAVEGIRQEKATAEQWLAMIQKNGGLKAGEDKWLGLSEWLMEASGEPKRTLTKDEVLEYIRQNQIEVEEVNYTDPYNAPSFGDWHRDEDGYRNGYDSKMFIEDVTNYAYYDGIKIGAFDNFDDAESALIKYTTKTNPINTTRLDYTTKGLENYQEIALTVPTIEPWHATDLVHFGDAGDGRAVAWIRFGETTDADSKRVLVIDEIQSNRHQEGREKGYKSELPKGKVVEMEAALEESRAFSRKMEEKYKADIYPGQWKTLATKEEVDHFDQLFNKYVSIMNELDYDRWVKGVPAAPFEKNWHEVAMKRMLRYAAENGYDKVVWTTGEQQAERYNLGNAIQEIYTFEPDDYAKEHGEYRNIELVPTGNGDPFFINVDKDGKVMSSDMDELRGRNLSEVVGKELSAKLMEAEPGSTIAGDNLRIGGEGMKGFYDQMLPRFMDKYCKKWGVRTTMVDLPEIGQKMHGVDVTPEMRESVLQGQPMFRGQELFEEGQTFPIHRKDMPSSYNVLGGSSSYSTELMPDEYGSEQALLDDLRNQYPEYFVSIEDGNVRMESWHHVLGSAAVARQVKGRNGTESYVNRKTRNAINAVKSLAGQMGLDVEVLTTTEGLKGKDARAKGIFNPRTGKIRLVLPNCANQSDLIKTLLHEGVAHFGLRQMFGEHFATFLDNVYNNVSPEVKRRIDAAMKSNGWSLGVATEEYLARLAERTDFDNAVNSGWWQKIKNFFIKMLAQAGVRLEEPLTDNELRYILWRSYDNLLHPDKRRTIFDTAKAVAMEHKLGVRHLRERERLQRTGRVDTSRIAAERAAAGEPQRTVPMVEEEEFLNRSEYTREIWDIINKAREDGTYMLAPNGKLTNLRDELQWAQVRTKAFKEWFGDWEKAAQEVHIVPAEKEHGFTNFADARNWAKQNIVRTYNNEETGGKGEIQISGRAVEKFMSEDAVVKSENKDVHMSVLKVLPSVIHDGIVGESHPDYKKVNGVRSIDNGINEGVTIHRVFGAVDIDGQIYRVKITLKEDRTQATKTKAYSYEATKIELLDGQSAAPVGTPRNSNSSITAAKLLNNLDKSHKKGEKLLDYSKVVDENGEPQVMYHKTNLDAVNKGEPFWTFYKDSHFGTKGQANDRLRSGKGTKIYEVFLNIRNPQRRNDADQDYLDEKDMTMSEYWERAVMRSRAFGHDGIVYLNEYEDKEHPADSWIAFEPNQVKSATDNSGDFSAEDDDIRYSIRTKEPPKKTGIGYKVFYLHDGQLYPPMVANPNGEGTPVGMWLDADDAPVIGKSKTGRDKVKAGGKGTQGGSGQLAHRPGWHLGEIPYALQFNRGEKVDNPLGITSKDGKIIKVGKYFPSDFVWAEVEYADDKSYQEEAESYGYNDAGNFQHSLAGLPRIPVDGSYKYRTNANPATDPWIITGAMRVNHILTRSEVDELVRKAGREPQQIQEGDIVTDEVVNQLNDEIQAMKEADEMGLLYSADEDWLDGMASEVYEKAVATDAVKMQEAWQDSMVSLKLIQDAIAHETGNVATGAEDAYHFENRMHGRAKNMSEQYDWRFYRPMLKAFNDFCKERGFSQEQGMEYLISKSGLERNVYFAFRDGAKEKVTEEIKRERAMLEEHYAKKRITEADYQTMKQDLDDKERNGVDDFMQKVRDTFAYQHAKQEYDEGNISYTEYLRIIETVIRGELKRNRPKRDGEGNVVSDNYYDDYVQDYSGLTETFAKGMYDDAQYVKKRAQRAIDPTERRYLWTEYNKQMRNAYITAREIAEDLVFAAEPAGEPAGSARRTVTDLWEKINAATKETLKQSYESGLIDRNNYNKVRAMFDWYIPLRGWEEDKASDVYTYMGKENVFSPAVKKTWGRRSKAENPLAYIGNIAVSTILSGHRNQMKQHFLNYVMNNPTSLVSISESWYENIAPEDESPVWILRTADTAGKSPDEIAQIVNDFNEEMKQKQRDGKAMPVQGRLRLDVNATSGQKSEHVVEVQRAGHTYQLYINGNPKAAQALNGSAVRAVSRISDTWLGKKITKVNRDMAMFFTSKNPAFVVSNLSRDLNMAGASIAVNEGKEYNARFIANVAKVLTPRVVTGDVGRLGLKGLIGKGRGVTGLMPKLMAKWKQGKLNEADETERLFKEFMNEGGETGFVNMLSIDSFKEKMQKEIAEMNGSSLFGAKAKVKETSVHKGLRLLGDTFEFYNRCAEDATRFIVYMTSRQMGKTLEESIADAKDVTLNFNRKGTGEKGSAELRDLFIFVNPAIQALANMYRMAKGHPLKFGAVTAAFVAGGVLMPILNQWFLNMWGDDDDKQSYWNLPPWVRKNNFVFWLPFTKNFVTIPLAQEFRVFYGVGEMMSSAIMEHPVDKWGLEVFSSVADLVPINPTGNGGNLMVDFAPTMVQPLMQVGENIDFTGKPIWRENQGNEHAPMYTKAYVSTPKWMVKVSEGFNDVTGGNEGKKGVVEKHLPFWGDYVNNPAVWNHLLQGYFGGMYNTIAKTFDVGVTAASGEMPKIYQTPVINRFLNRPVERDNAGALGEDYYNLKQERDALRYELRVWQKKVESLDEGTAEHTAAMEHVEEILSSPEWKKAEVVTHYEKIMKDLKAGERAATQDADKQDIKESISLFKQQMLEELHALDDGKEPLEAALEAYRNADTFAEKNKLRVRIERLMMRDDGKTSGQAAGNHGRNADVEKALSYVRDEEKESRDTNEHYLALATAENIRDDARIKAAKAKIKPYVSEYKQLVADGRHDKAAQYRQKHLKYFNAQHLIDQLSRAMNSNKKLLGKGNDKSILRLIDSQRSQMLKAIEAIE